MSDVTPRKGMPSPRLSENDFRRRYLEQFSDPAFGPRRGTRQDRGSGLGCL